VPLFAANFSDLSTHFTELLLSPKAKIEGGDNLALQKIAPLIHQIRGERVILDADLARIYGVTTKRLNEQVKRNADRFPNDFAFALSKEEWESLRSQSVTSDSHRSQIAPAHLRSQIATSSLHGGRRYMPYAFTEHGAIMAANVLNSNRLFR
jgi:hypothetical protein